MLHNCPAAQVSNPVTEHTVLLFIMTSFWRIALWPGLDNKDEDDPLFSPLPEGLDNPVLEKMLEPAPCLVPSKEDEGGIKRAKAGLHCYLFQPMEWAPPRGRITEGKNLTFSLPGEGRGLPPKIRKSRFPNGRRNLCQRVLPRRVFLPHNVRAGISPLTSCK